MTRSRRSFALVALVVLAIIGVGGLLVLQKPPLEPTARVAYRAAGLKPDRAGAAQAAVKVTPAQPPGRLIIPSIGVNAPVVAVGVDQSGAMGVTNTSTDTGWYKLGPAPGDPGDAVIDGHLDWYGTPRAVFFHLKDLRTGDDIEVQGLDGVSRHFKVTGVQTVAYNATVPGLFGTTGPARLSLITCGGTWNSNLGQYAERVVVDSALAG